MLVPNGFYCEQRARAGGYQEWKNGGRLFYQTRLTIIYQRRYYLYTLPA